MKIIALDPGNSTGWVFYDDVTKEIKGGTIPESLTDMYVMLETLEPTVVILERFALYPDKAKSLSFNTFYPVEVIGVIKLWCQMVEITPIIQGADKKKYSGGLDDNFILLKQITGKECTEHTKDAYLHLRYYLRNRK